MGRVNYHNLFCVTRLNPAKSSFSFRLLKRKDPLSKVRNFIKMVSLFLLLGAFSVAKAFEITSSSPDIITVKKGGDMDLWCKTDGYWEWCKISKYTHKCGETFDATCDTACEHAWNSNDYNVKGSQTVLR